MKFKISVLFLLLAALFAMLPIRANAVKNVVSAQADALKTSELKDSLSEESRRALGNIAPEAGIDFDKAISSVWEKTSGKISEYIGSGIKCAVMLMAAVMLCSIGSGFGGSAGSALSEHLVQIAGAMAIVAIAAGSVNTLIGLGKSTIEELNTFSKVLLPTIAAAAAAAGAPTSAAAKQLSAVLFSDVLLTVINKLLLPAVYVYVVICVADACIEFGKLKKLSEFLKKCISRILVLILSAFTGYSAISSAVTGAADTLAIKAAKSVVSAVPVVGGIMADASDTIIAGAAILKNAVGVFGVVALAAICAAPCIHMAVQFLFFKVSAAVSSTIGSDKLTDLIDDLGGAIGLVLAMTAGSALLFFISVFNAVSVVS